ncbi:hypothetical protein ACFQ9X_18310 [Catenulispora yoronensis]
MGSAIVIRAVPARVVAMVTATRVAPVRGVGSATVVLPVRVVSVTRAALTAMGLARGVVSIAEAPLRAAIVTRGVGSATVVLPVRVVSVTRAVSTVMGPVRGVASIAGFLRSARRS